MSTQQPMQLKPRMRDLMASDGFGPLETIPSKPAGPFGWRPLDCGLANWWRSRRSAKAHAVSLAETKRA